MSNSAPARLAGGRRQVHLTGFMGSGKSTVGKLLARRLLWNFLDLDGVIERHVGRSVARIFADEGESAFREHERHVLRQVVGKPETVVALGGGTLMDAGNLALSRERGVLVWLRCSLEVLAERCAGDAVTRPLWAEGEAMRARYRERLPGFEAAEIVVDGDGEPERVADDILAALGVAGD